MGINIGALAFSSPSVAFNDILVIVIGLALILSPLKLVKRLWYGWQKPVKLPELFEGGSSEEKKANNGN